MWIRVDAKNIGTTLINTDHVAMIMPVVDGGKPVVGVVAAHFLGKAPIIINGSIPDVFKMIEVSEKVGRL